MNNKALTAFLSLFFLILLPFCQLTFAQDANNRQNSDQKKVWLKSIDEIASEERFNKVLTQEMVENVKQRFMYQSNYTLEQILQYSGLKIKQDFLPLLLQKSKDTEIIAASVSPYETALKGEALLFILSIKDISYPLLVDPGLNDSVLKIEVLGTSKAWKVEITEGKLGLVDIKPFSPNQTFANGDSQIQPLSIFENNLGDLTAFIGCILVKIAENLGLNDPVKVICALNNYRDCVGAMFLASASVCTVPALLGCLNSIKPSLCDFVSSNFFECLPNIPPPPPPPSLQAQVNGRDVSVSGSNYTPDGLVAISLYFKNSNRSAGDLTVYTNATNNGNINKTFFVSSSLPEGEYYLIAADSKRSFSNTLKINIAGGSNNNCFASVPSNHWKGRYFTGRFVGSEVMTRDDGEGFLVRDFRDGSPGGCMNQTDFFSAIWETDAYFSTSGSYEFVAFTDDGIEVAIDGKIELSEFYAQSREHRFTKQLSAGNHKIVIRWFEEQGGAVCKLSWKLSSSGGGTNQPSLNLVRDARKLSNGTIRLTSSEGGKVGAAWFTDKRNVRDSFSATFQFEVSNQVGGGADGFTLAIQNNSTNEIGGGGDNMGIVGVPNSIAVMFDTYRNDPTKDPSDNFVKFKRSDGSIIPSFIPIPNMSSGTHVARIDYVPGTLSIYIDGNLAMSISVNIANSIPLDNGRAYIGFTAATGGSAETHDILNWDLPQ
ncbi:MAG: hypothetical protein FD167_1415 [bacterium]|nr:MAG: hypothetical protein FD167_1415 [bacterium]